MNTSRKIITCRDVMEITGLSRVSVWRFARDPDNQFPAAIQISENRIGWWDDEIIAWLESRKRVVAGSDDLPDRDGRVGQAV